VLAARLEAGSRRTFWTGQQGVIADVMFDTKWDCMVITQLQLTVVPSGHQDSPRLVSSNR
jgi:hypothetical protein